MSPEEQTRKLGMISRLPPLELQGWPDGWKHDKREPFPGEIAALEQRKRELGLRE